MRWNELDIDLKGRTSGNVNTICPKCSHDRKKKRATSLSVNIDLGVFLCHHCHWSGSAKPIELKQKVYQIPDFNNTELSDKALGWFTTVRGISKATLLRMKVTEEKKFVPQVAAERTCIAFNYFRNDKIVNIKYRDAAKNFFMVKEAELIFYGLSCIEGQSECVICEGEIDQLSFYEAGITSVVSVPNGASKGSARLEYLDNCYQVFEDKQKIYLATDTDEAGLILREELARRLGKERCYTIIFPDGCKDANDVLVKHGASELHNCYTAAKQFPLEGIYDVLSIESAIDGLYKNGFPKGLKIGMPEFDQLISWRTGELTTVTGIPNCFIGATDVKTINGFKKIKDIQRGEMVLSWNHSANSEEYRCVLEKYHYRNTDIGQIMITFVLTSGEKITSTLNHEYYTEGNYVSAFELARRVVDASSRNELEILYKQQGEIANNILEASHRRADEGNEARIRRVWLFKNHDFQKSENAYYKDAPLSGTSIYSKPHELPRSKPHQRDKGRQQGRELRVDFQGSTRQAYVEGGEYSQTCEGRSEWWRSKANESRCNRNEGIVPKGCSGIRSAQAITEVQHIQKCCSKNSNTQTLETHLICSIEWEYSTEDVFDLCVEGNHNYTVSKDCIHVHNSGKSEFMDEIYMRLAALHGWKFGIFSPENLPVELHFAKLAEKYTGEAFYSAEHKMSETSLALSKTFIQEHFYFVRADVEDLSIDYLLDKARELILRKGINAFVIDPWNRVDHNIPSNMNEHQYINLALTQIYNFKTRYNVHVFVVAHPKKINKDRDGKHEVPTLYDISGSANFFNKTDNGLTAYRDFHNNRVYIYVQKIRWKFIGRIGSCEFEYHLPTGRYKELGQHDYSKFINIKPEYDYPPEWDN